MKKLLFLLISVLIYSCGNAPSTEYNEEDLKRYSEIKDSLKQKIEGDANERVFGDTIGSFKSPVKVLASKIIESGNYRNVHLSYKNISDKKIEAIKFRWRGEDAFGDPAEMGNVYAKGFGDGFDDRGLNVNKTESAQWSILSPNAKKITSAWVTEVAFSDGTKWTIGD